MPKTGDRGDWLEELKSRLDIVNVVSRYVPLEQKGRNFWGRCPFHHEKTPSFAVNPERQAYKCFGCGAGGDAIKFVEEMESCDFMEAVKILAERVGYTLPDFSHRRDEDIEKRKEKKERLLAAMKEAARFYYASLSLPAGKAAREYLQKRRVPQEVAKRFGLGASPGWEDLVRHLTAKGFTREELGECGLAYEKNGKWLDSLATRLIFPIIDSFGNVVAFGGRELADSGFAKYKNTSDTVLFDKSKTLYALNLVKKFRREETVDSLIVVEGYMDTISLHAAGFRNAVASMGTSLTEQQAKLVKRMVDKVYISYDGDAAGRKATIRGLDILKSEGLDVYVVQLPEGLDPDDIIKQRGAQFYRSLLDAALPLTDYKLKVLKGLFDLNKPEDKRKYALRALGVIKGLGSNTEREDYLKLVKSETGFTYESLKSDLNELMTTGTVTKQAAAEPAPRLETGADKAVRFLLCEMLSGKTFAYGGEDLSSYLYDNVHRMVYEYCLSCKKNGRAPDAEEAAGYVGEEGRSELDRILSAARSDLTGADEERYFRDCLDVFKREGLSMQIEILTRELEAETDGERRKRIGKMISENMLKMQQLK